MAETAVRVATTQGPTACLLNGPSAPGIILAELAEDKHRVERGMAIASRRVQQPPAAGLLVLEDALHNGVGLGHRRVGEPTIMNHVQRGRYVTNYIAVFRLNHEGA